MSKTQIRKTRKMSNPNRNQQIKNNQQKPSLKCKERPKPTPEMQTKPETQPEIHAETQTQTPKPIPKHKHSPKSTMKHKHKHRNDETHTETETQMPKWVSDGGLGLGAWVGDELRKKDGWSLAGERHTQIEQCDGTIKAPSGQGRQDSGEKLGSGSEWRGFSLCAGPGSLLLFPLGFGRLGFFFNVCI